MSYNIDNWKTKRLVNLRLPLIAYTVGYTAERIARGWRPDIRHCYETNEITLGLDCESNDAITGTLTDDNWIHVKELCLYGEGSGTAYRELLLPMLAQSQGELEAVLVWAGGDSITRLTVQDGQVTETEIEL